MHSRLSMTIIRKFLSHESPNASVCSTRLPVSDCGTGEYVHMLPMDYVNLVRVQYACEQMKHGNDSMDEVARKAGFSTTSTFNRNFKKFFNTSPYQWKINPQRYERKLQNFHINALKGW